MNFLVDCPCGRRLTVTSSQAGLSVRCGCGDDVAVPSLSVLRSESGLGAYESGPIDAIREMLKRGEFPGGYSCAACGEPTQEVCDLYVQCERVYMKGDGKKEAMFLAIFISPLLALAMRRTDPVRREGRDTFVATPLRVCPRHQGRLSGPWNRNRLRRLLAKVPAYARLFEAYPGRASTSAKCPRKAAFT